MRTELSYPKVEDVLIHFPELRGVHEAANCVPYMTDVEMRRLVRSIGKFGLGSPVLVTPEGLLIDGRMRVIACWMTGTSLRTQVHCGCPYAAVRSANCARKSFSEEDIEGVREKIRAMDLPPEKIAEYLEMLD